MKKVVVEVKLTFSRNYLITANSTQEAMMTAQSTFMALFLNKGLPIEGSEIKVNGLDI